MPKFTTLLYPKLILLILSILPASLYSQTSFVDSLNNLVKSNSHDTIIIDAINKTLVSHSNNYPHLLIPFSEIAIKKSQELNDSFRLSQSFNRKAVAYYFMGDYNTALDIYFKSLQISEKLKEPILMISDYNNIGLVLLEEDIFDEALLYFQKAEMMMEKSIPSRKDLKARVYDNIGITYYRLDEFDNALVWFEKSLQFSRELSLKQTMASNIKNVGNVFLSKSNYELALTHFSRSIEIYQEIDNKLEVAGLLNKIGYVLARLNRFAEAEEKLNLARTRIDELKTSSLRLENERLFALYHEMKGDYRKASTKWNSYNNLRDSIEKADKRKVYQQLKTLAETNEKIKDLELLQRLNAAQDETIKSQKIIQKGVVLLLALSLLLLGFIVNALYTKSRANKNLEELVEKRTQELKAAKEKAELSDKIKTAFLENISHEVRTPMNAIVGFSNLLISRDYDEEERNDMLHNISMSTYRLLNLFEKVSLLALLENRDVEVVKSNCILNTLFEELQLRYFNRLNQCDLPVSINYFIPDGLYQKELVLPAKMVHNILDELLDNATKFTASGAIAYGVKEEGESLQFFVKDTGIGIAPEHFSKIFDKFEKFTPSHCNNCDGAGIGLTIVKKTIELIGGNISINSQKGKGTQVEFTLPVDESKNFDK